MDALVPGDAVVEIVTGGHDWVEGPVWNGDGGYLDGIPGPGGRHARSRSCLLRRDGWAKDPEKLGAPDGMKIEASGNLFAAGPGGVHLFSSRGKHLGSLSTNVAVGNVAFGGEFLYIAASDAIYRVRVSR